MSHARTEHNRLDWLAKDLNSLLLPLLNDVPCDLHPPLGSLVRRPLTRHLLSPCHVYLFGNKYFQGYEYLVIHQLLSRDSRDHILIDVSQPLCEGSRSQANDSHLRVVVDELNCCFSSLMRFVNDQQR